MNAFKHQSGYQSQAAISARLPYYFYAACVSASLAASLILISNCATAQTADIAPGTAQAASSAAPVATPPRYSAPEIERAFNFMDTNRDGKISREEAAAFRNVARHFDAADTNKDNALSLEEFGSALNRP